MAITTTPISDTIETNNGLLTPRQSLASDIFPLVVRKIWPPKPAAHPWVSLIKSTDIIRDTLVLTD